MQTSEVKKMPAAEFDDLPVKLFIYPSIIFMVLGMAFGLFISFNGFVAPDY
jgi:cytochrome c oxidase cbb3-type subunit 1